MTEPAHEGDLTRRNFVWGLAGLFAGASLPLGISLPAPGREPDEPWPAAARLARCADGLLPDLAPGSLGPDRPAGTEDVEELTRSVYGRIGLDPDAALPESELRRRLARLFREEFARGDVKVIDGWVLAATEARLLGLAATLAPSGRSPR